MSVFPTTACNRCCPNELVLYATRVSKIRTYGSHLVKLNLGFQRPLSWSFMVCDVGWAIISTDFLCHFNLLVVRNRKLIVGATLTNRTS